MKSIAKLILRLTVTYIFIFVSAGFFQFLSLWIEGMRTVPPPGDVLSTDLLQAGQEAVPWAFYLSILLTLGWTLREGVGILLSTVSVVFLSLGFTLLFSLGMEQVLGVKPVLGQIEGFRIGDGLIISSPEPQVLLKQPAGMARVLSVPGKPLFYQGLPSDESPPLKVPLGEEEDQGFRHFRQDMYRAGVYWAALLAENVLLFCFYLGTLSLLLCSFRFLLGFAHSPMVYFFCGCLLYRIILALEVFLSGQEVQDFLKKFTGILLTPFLFALFALFIYLFTAMFSLGKTKSAPPLVGVEAS